MSALCKSPAAGMFDTEMGLTALCNVCVLVQYMIGYQATESIASSIIFFVNGSKFSRSQVALTTLHYVVCMILSMYSPRYHHKDGMMAYGKCKSSCGTCSAIHAELTRVCPG